MKASLAFHRRLGWTIEAPSAFHAVAQRSPAPKVEFDTPDFARTWDPGSTGDCGGTSVLGLSVETRDAVDDLYTHLLQAGHRGRHAPHDAFWGARYAIIEDPDRNPVGIMSPSREPAPVAFDGNDKRSQPRLDGSRTR